MWSESALDESELWRESALDESELWSESALEESELWSESALDESEVLGESALDESELWGESALDESEGFCVNSDKSGGTDMEITDLIFLICFIFLCKLACYLQQTFSCTKFNKQDSWQQQNNISVVQFCLTKCV